MDPVDVGAAGAVRLQGGGVRDRPEVQFLAGLRDRRAELYAVPDGASAFPAWCISMISADSKNLAASRANRVVSTAPMAKFGTTMTPRSGLTASHSRMVFSRSSVNPEVPTTA